MSEVNLPDRIARQLIRIKRWEGLSAALTLILPGILIICILVIYFGYPILTPILVNEDDPVQAARWVAHVNSFVHQAWSLTKNPLYIGVGLWVVVIISYILARFAYRAEMRKVMKEPERVQILDSLIHKVKNRHGNYRESVESILDGFGIHRFLFDAWPAWQPFTKQVVTKS